ncbi:histidine triad nucleotide-binding protein [Herminiimonas sp. CN]|uniref:histidine triad nucleotide-binding protein n=1 Tax=Herminiimonas sp. CN TaxID=1349818 RepID=UPI000473C5DB|nr:histidine triad nucleotide-binding protein [Herminiimonas sp. CN]
MDNCIFCKIAAKIMPSEIVYEDDTLLAFKDINPAAPVHLLVIPKQHIGTLSDCGSADAGLLAQMLLLAPKLAKEFGCALTNDANNGLTGGYRTMINTGPDGGQEVYHLHLHVIGGPRPWRGRR